MTTTAHPTTELSRPVFLTDGAWSAAVPVLRRLRTLLGELGFERTRVLPMPGSQLDLVMEPASVRNHLAGRSNLFDRSPLAGLHRRALGRTLPTAAAAHELFTLCRPAPIAEVRSLLGGNLVDDLLAVSVLSEQPDSMVRTDVLAVPFRGGLYLADPPRLQHDPDYVYLGRSSFTIPQHLIGGGWWPPHDAGSPRVLDLGCGSGVGLIPLAGPGIEAVGADIVERCLRFGRVNAALNGVDADFRWSDVLSGVDGDFDLVILNSPCMWEELQTQTFAGGGGDYGTSLPMRMIGESLDRLRPDGRLAAVVSAPVFDDREYPYVFDAIGRATQGRSMQVDVTPLITEFEHVHAGVFRRHRITQLVRYLVVMRAAERPSVEMLPPVDRLRYGGYWARTLPARGLSRVRPATRR
ncbi:MAG: methyltransferase [Acidimicrobiales bacterium]